MRRSSRWSLLAAGLAVGLSAFAPVSAVAPPSGSSDAQEQQLRLVAQETVSEREIDVTFETTALDAPTTARVVLPDEYDPSGETRYPMLMLLHGGAGQYTDWAHNGLLELTEGLPLITVLPDAGRSAWYTDWFNNGLRGTPMWETYHLEQLLPWVDEHFPTVGERHARAIAGLSSGGFGAMSYASRNPDLFVAAAGFSGALDTNTPPVVAGKAIDGLAAQDGGLPGSLFGLRETEEVRWRGSNPWDLAPNLRDTDLTVRAGTGESGGEFGGGGPTDPGGFALEVATYEMSLSFHQRLEALGIDHVWEAGPGTHNYDYWRRDLALTLPTFFEVFDERRPDPTPFSYRSIERDYEVYGWSVTIDRPAVEFSEFEDVSTDGFTLSGSGVATVVTAPIYRPDRRYEVVTSSEHGETATTLTADEHGRLSLSVPLGPSNLAQQQFTPTHRSPLTRVHTTEVTIAPALGGCPDTPAPTSPPRCEPPVDHRP
jgi:S-formylglutathione hydrolase FrmB